MRIKDMFYSLKQAKGLYIHKWAQKKQQTSKSLFRVDLFLTEFQVT